MLSLRLGPAEVRFTGRDDGDFSSQAIGRDERERAVTDRPWKTARQVHGARAVIVDATTATAGDGDALVTTDPRVAIGVRTADCAPVVLASPAGVIGVAHAGWRGLMAGVLASAVAGMRELGATTIDAALGPCIGAECYEFGEPDLATLASRFGEAVRATTATGRPALDVREGVRTALDELDVRLVEDMAICTACDPRGWWSHRARGDLERQATVAWLA